MSDVVRRLALQRKDILSNIDRLKNNLKEVDEEILSILEADQDITKYFGPDSGKKDYGEQTFMKGECKVTLKKSKRVKYDNDAMIKAGQQLSWDELNRFFSVKFDMSETGYRELQAVALASDRYSDILSMVDDAREVIVGEVTLGKIEIIEE